MRASIYNIYVPFADSGQFILVHGYTGAVDLVSPDVVDFLQDFEQRSGYKRDKSMDQKTIETLMRRGYLTKKTPDEENQHLIKIARLLLRKYQKVDFPEFAIIPTYDCNLRCFYCYERKLRQKGSGWLKTRITKDQIDAIFQAIPDLCSGNINKGEITLYGGEPLLAGNLGIVEYIIKKGRNLNLSFSAVTNGVDLERFEDFLGNKNITRLQISMDGPPEIHDKRRFLTDGSGTFQLISRNINTALDRGVKVTLRINVDRLTVSGLPTLIRIMEEKGWFSQERFWAYVSTVHCPAKLFSQQMLRDSELFQELDKVKELVSEPKRILINDGGIKKLFKKALSNNHFPPLRASFCASGAGMYVFDPFGDVYGCWETVGDAKQRIGRYFPELRIGNDFMQSWSKINITNLRKCQECKYALFCAGGCIYRIYDSSISDSFCEDFQICFAKSVVSACGEFLQEKSQTLNNRSIDRREVVKGERKDYALK
jgi:uncharacterized protein